MFIMPLVISTFVSFIFFTFSLYFTISLSSPFHFFVLLLFTDHTFAIPFAATFRTSEPRASQSVSLVSHRRLPYLWACLKGWPVGSATLPRAHFRVCSPFPLPRPGPLEAKLPPPPDSSHTPFSTVARGLGSARC
jgi:hypothetical protein